VRSITVRGPALVPAVGTAVTTRNAHAYSKVRDGIDASATAIRTAAGVAGFTTLPDGTMVYATTGLGAGEGRLNLYNLNMPGVPGLDGNRTFAWSGGSANLAGAGGGGLDEVRFPSVPARFVRMYGQRAATQYGFSLWEMAVHNGSSGNLALGKAATASSFSTGFAPSAATDGNTGTRWAVATDQRAVPGWLSVDLGQAQPVDRVVLSWETAYASHLRIEVSADGQAWQSVARIPASS
jgi:F5/8 type C domain-containing protein